MSTSSSGTNARACPSWPGCPPGRLPVGSRRGRLPRAWGGSLDGGRDEVREVCCTCSHNCWTVASSAAMRRSNARLYAWAAGGVRSHISGGKGIWLSMGEDYRRHRCYLARVALSDHVNVYLFFSGSWPDLVRPFPSSSLGYTIS